MESGSYRCLRPMKNKMDSIEEKIQEDLKDAPNDSIILMSTGAEEYFTAVLSALEILLNQRKMGGVYITISRPYSYLSRVLREKGIIIKDLLFIDCISCMAGEMPGERERCIFIESPTSLEEMAMYIDRLAEQIKTPDKFLFLDSLSTLLIYNSLRSAEEFSHFLINRLRLKGMGGIFVSIEHELPEDLPQVLSQVCDKTIHV